MSNQNCRFCGLRAVALFEGAKAVSILLVGFGLLSLIGKDVEDVAANLLKHLHLNPVSKYPRIFLDAARHVSKTDLWVFASLALADAVLRLVEAVGLWNERDWAKWLGVLTAGVYLPIEIYEMILQVTWLKSAALLTNVVIVVYLGYDIYAPKSRTPNYRTPVLVTVEQDDPAPHS
jgi:uncharacterized membrane protein (DUF2068 family)